MRGRLLVEVVSEIAIRQVGCLVADLAAGVPHPEGSSTVYGNEHLVSYEYLA